MSEYIFLRRGSDLYKPLCPSVRRPYVFKAESLVGYRCGTFVQPISFFNIFLSTLHTQHFFTSSHILEAGIYIKKENTPSTKKKGKIQEKKRKEKTGSRPRKSKIRGNKISTTLSIKKKKQFLKFYFFFLLQIPNSVLLNI